MYMEQKKYEEAEKYFSLAEEIIPLLNQEPEYFKLYRFQSDLYFAWGDCARSRHYDELHDEGAEAYARLQGEIRTANEQYNMELIAQRYFDKLEEQERVASIMLYAKIIVGVLLAVIGYFIFFVLRDRYRKKKMLDDIDQKMVEFGIVDSLEDLEAYDRDDEDDDY